MESSQGETQPPKFGLSLKSVGSLMTQLIASAQNSKIRWKLILSTQKPTQEPARVEVTGSYCLRHQRVDNCMDVRDMRDLGPEAGSHFTSHVLSGNTYTSTPLPFGSDQCEADFTLRTLSQLWISSYIPPQPVTKYSFNFPPIAYSTRKGTKTFTDLPTELRLKIWKAAFPDSCHVSMDVGCKVFHMAGYVCTTNLPLKLPVTLFVNRESRYETLRHYYLKYPVMCISRYSQKVCMRRPFCFNPTVDSAYLELGDKALDIDLNKWLKYLKIHSPKLLNDLRVLEVRDMDFRMWGEQTWHEIFEKRFYGFEDTMLPFFPNLEILCFTSKAPKDEIPRMAAMSSAREIAGLRHFQLDANSWYKRRIAKEGSFEGAGANGSFFGKRLPCKILVDKIRTPKIICRQWTKLSEGPFDPYSDEEEL